MKRTRRRRPYTREGRTSFPARNQPGAYLIHDQRGHIVYVGMGAEDVYKALYRHFQTWNDKTRERVTFPRSFTVRVVYTKTPAWARKLERALILKHRPSGNPNKLEQYELTDALARVAERADNADWMPSTEAAPF